MSWSLILFAALSGAAIYSAYKVATTELITHAALFLAVVFLALAGFFVSLNAEFLAVVQVLVYAGAVMAVIVFAIMLSEIRELGAEPGEGQTMVQRFLSGLRSPRWSYLPLVISGGLVALIMVAYNQMNWAAAGEPLQNSTVAIGERLFSDFIIPFEAVALVLLVAMIGAIVLTGEEDL